MSIKLTCSACGKNLSLRDELGGKKIRCPVCQAVLPVPTGAAAEPVATNISAAVKKAASAPVHAAAVAKSSNRQIGESSRSFAAPSATAPTVGAGKSASGQTSGKIAPLANSSAAVSATSTMTITKGKTANFCPLCKKRVPDNILICPHCSYHFKLKKKVNNLSQAIKQADFRAQGLSATGETKAASIINVEQRSKYTENLRRWMKIIIAVILLAVCGFFTTLIYRSYSNIPLAELRAQYRDQPASSGDLSSWQPVWVYADGDPLLTCQIPLDKIQILKIIDGKNPANASENANEIEVPLRFPEKWPQRQRVAGARFAETVLAPVVDTIHERTNKSRYNFTSARILPTIIGQINKLGGPFSPKNLDNYPPKGRVIIWRRAKADEPGGLRGAILVLTETQQDELIAAIDKWKNAVAERAEGIASAKRKAAQNSDSISEKHLAATFPSVATPNLRVSAKLSFTPFANKDLLSGADGYAGAVTSGAIRVKKLDALPRSRAESRNLVDPNACFFAPVLLVESMAFDKTIAGK